MIVTINKELNLKGGTVFKGGTKLKAIALYQPLKGCAVVIVGKNENEDYVIGMDDLDKISITPEIPTSAENDAINQYLDARDNLRSLGL